MRLHRVLWGYYRDHVKGTEFDRHRKNWIAIGTVTFCVVGYGVWLIVSRHWDKKMHFYRQTRPSEEWIRSRENQRLGIVYSDIHAINKDKYLEYRENDIERDFPIKITPK